MPKSALHDALTSLSPTTPSDLPLSSSPKPEVDAYITSLLASAQTIIDSLPTSSSSSPTTVSNEWKLQSSKNASFEIYKLSSKDGKGTWFGRRSVQRGIGFGRFKRGLQKEFGNAVEEGAGGDVVEEEKREGRMKRSIRGIGVERKVEGVRGGAGGIDVYHLKAQFPGPSAPRDFITCCITSEMPHDSHPSRNQFTMISRPLRDHPETEVSKESGFVRGEYESIEFIREIDDPDADSISLDVPDSKNGGRAIEWIMITRSNPGGNVPKWMVERGTPGSIVQDAEKFLKWVEGDTKELITPRPSMDGRDDVVVGDQTTKEVVTPGKVDKRELIHTGLVDEDEVDGGIVLPKDETPKTEETQPGNSGWLPNVTNLASSITNTVSQFVPTNRTETRRPSLPHQSTSNLTFRTARSNTASPSPSLSPLITPTASTSSLSLSLSPVTSPVPLPESTQSTLSIEEARLFETHESNNTGIKAKATEALTSLDEEERSLAPSDLTPAPLNSPTLTKEQKNLLKRQIRIKDKRAKLQQRLEKDLKKESKRYQKDLDKLRDRAQKAAKREKEREEKDVRKRMEKVEKAIQDVASATEAVAEAEEEVEDVGSVAGSAASSATGSGVKRNASSARSWRGRNASGKEEELRGVVRGLTEEVVGLRRQVAELEEEVMRLRGEKVEGPVKAVPESVGTVGGNAPVTLASGN